MIIEIDKPNGTRATLEQEKNNVYIVRVFRADGTPKLLTRVFDSEEIARQIAETELAGLV